MEPFVKLTAIAAPLPMINVDTDMIIPKQFLRSIKRSGFGKNLFNDMRFDEQGKPKPDFVLNRKPYDKAQILMAGENFGCGSSREHAPWALLDFGIRCVIAPSFADIFYNNCFKNGVLPVRLPQKDVDLLMKEAQAGHEITVDLEKRVVQAAGLPAMPFTLDDFRRHCLLNGLDDIGLTLEKARNIAAHEAANQREKPWLWAKSGS